MGQNSQADHEDKAVSDAELLRRYAVGDHDAITWFVQRWEQSLLTIAYRIVGQPADAEEVRQTVLLKILREDNFEAIVNLPGWIRRITVNESIDFLRRRDRRMAIEVADHPIARQAGDANFDNVEQLTEVLQTLPPETRALLALRFDDGLTIREIGEVLETPHTTIQSRLQAALELLRTKLGVSI